MDVREREVADRTQISFVSKKTEGRKSKVMEKNAILNHNISIK